MKRCPTCDQEFSETWLSFCPSDGSVLRESEVSAPEPAAQDKSPTTSREVHRGEQATLNRPREPILAGSWAMPDEQQPAQPLVWRPPPPPAPLQPPSQSLALASMITGIAGWVIGCFGPVPGIAALIMGLMALSQIKKSPERVGGKPFAVVGVIVGSLSILGYAVLILYLIALIASAGR